MMKGTQGEGGASVCATLSSLTHPVSRKDKRKEKKDWGENGPAIIEEFEAMERLQLQRGDPEVLDDLRGCEIIHDELPFRLPVSDASCSVPPVVERAAEPVEAAVMAPLVRDLVVATDQDFENGAAD